VCGGYDSVPLLARESLCVVTVLLTVVGGDTPCLDSVCTAVACTACCLCGKQRAVPACIAVKPAHHSSVHHFVHMSGLVQLEMCMRAVAHVDKDSLAVHAHAHTQATVAVGCDSTATEGHAEGGCKGLSLQLCDSCNLGSSEGQVPVGVVYMQQRQQYACSSSC
jgi:hypothetical protein